MMPFPTMPQPDPNYVERLRKRRDGGHCMTSEEIKLALENPPEGKYLNLESVLCEIAYQLAVHNEREVEAMPSQGPGKRTLRAKLAWWIAGPALRLIRQEVTELAKANQQLEGRIAVLEAMLGRNLSTVEFRQC